MPPERKRMPERTRGFRARLLAVTRRQQRGLKARPSDDAVLTAVGRVLAAHAAGYTDPDVFLAEARAGLAYDDRRTPATTDAQEGEA